MNIFVKWQISKQSPIAKCNKNKIIKMKVVYVYLFGFLSRVLYEFKQS